MPGRSMRSVSQQSASTRWRPQGGSSRSRRCRTQYNLADRTYDDVVDYCEENGIVFVPYYPLKFDGPPALEQVARSRDATPEQIALAWLLRRSPVMLPIPGTTSIEHLRENLAALDVGLTDAEFEALG